MKYLKAEEVVKDGWTLPDPPEGFDTAVAFYHLDGDVVLDWLREPQCDFASEYPDKKRQIEWPFKDGVPHKIDGIPNVELWESIGIMPLW